MQALVFDLDGTLVDSAPDLRAAANGMLAKLGHAPLDLETVIGFIGQGVEVLVRRVLDHSGVADDAALRAAALAEFHARYAADPVTLTRPYAGAVALLAALDARGHPLAICTNKPEAPARDICDRLGLSRYLRAVVGGDTLAVRKPDPAPLHEALARIGARGMPALYVGDSETDWRTARAAGLPFAYFEGGYQRGPIDGFDPDHRLRRLSDLGGIVGL